MAVKRRKKRKRFEQKATKGAKKNFQKQAGLVGKKKRNPSRLGVFVVQFGCSIQ
jgi:hypothetical protein